MEINVKKLVTGKIGTSSTHELEAEIVINDQPVQVQGKVSLTRTEEAVEADFNITAILNLHFEDESEASSRHQIPLNFQRTYTLHAIENLENQMAVIDNKIETDLAVLPELHANLPIQAI